jgi:hypothetical protein
MLGSCYVIAVPATSGWREGWNCFPQKYVCPANSVRVYQPGVHVDRPNDHRRHRFFLEDEIRRHARTEEQISAQDALISVLRDAFTRRLLRPYPGRVWNCSDVALLRADRDFRRQVSLLSSGEEELKLYREEYRRLVEDKQTRDHLIADADNERQEATAEAASLREHNAELIRQRDRAIQALETNALSRSGTTLIKNLMENGATVANQLALIELAMPDAVCVLESAYRSARECEGFEEVEELRKTLVNLVLRHRQSLLDGDVGKASQVFGAKKHAPRESANLSTEGRRARTFSYGGQSIFMEQHLKIGYKESDHRCLRIHFYWDSKSAKIVIGHCGPHLPL